MSRAVVVFIVIVLALLGVGAVVLGTLDIPAPSATVERPIPDQRFPR